MGAYDEGMLAVLAQVHEAIAPAAEVDDPGVDIDPRVLLPCRVMAVTFQLCDVVRANTPLRETTVQRAIHGLVHTPIEACGAGVDGLVDVAMNAFVFAAWRAYADHRPLVLSPDAVWLCIAQGFAAHVAQNAEALRGRFVRHQGKQTLKVTDPGFIKGSPNNPWPMIFAAFSAQIASHIGRQRDLVACDFSTTGPIERAASEIVLMDAMQHYFEYEVTPICGIPEITLTGTVDDWRSIRQRAAHLAEYELGWWTSVLLPMLDELVATAEGRPDLAFWHHFIENSESPGCGGGTNLHGWILLFFPYLTGSAKNRPLLQNPVLTRARGTSPRDPRGGPAAWLRDASLEPGSIPLGLSRAPLKWVGNGGSEHDMDLIGGFVGLAQDRETLALRPAIGWAVRDHHDEIRQRRKATTHASNSYHSVGPSPGLKHDSIDRMYADDDDA